MPRIITVLLVAFICYYNRVTSFLVADTSRTNHALDAARQRAVTHNSQQTTNGVQQQCHCLFCESTFSSRNALFQHIRTNPECSVAAGHPPLLKRYSVAVMFGYYCNKTECGEYLRDAFVNATKEITGQAELVSCTQSSVARSRPMALGMEDGCPAARDVLVLNLMAPPDAFEEKLNEIVAAAGVNTTDVMIHACKLMPPKRKFHAEAGCTQHVFQYLVPARWLPDPDEFYKWYEQYRDDLGVHKSRPKHNNRTVATSASLLRMKEALRGAESAKEIKQRATGARFMTLAFKERLAWHNYADPALQGAASPNNGVVWRIVDRARYHSLVEDGDDCQVYIVYEFCGDEFLHQQVRRMMAAAIAVAHGWLPNDFFEQSTRRQVLIETPIAPAWYLFRSNSRFHFEEISFQGKSIFDAEDVYKVNNESDPILQMQQHLIKERRGLRAMDDKWLQNLQETVAPSIRRQLSDCLSTRKQTDSKLDSKQQQLFSTPQVYEQVLLKLQNIVATKQWPATSQARSSVILDSVQETNAGSFTIVNSKCFPNTRAPLGNLKFPDLVKAVFDLERALSNELGSTRPSSSHCAVNCNAQFTPHVDSGTGAGQSVSMIVGLGDYSGGELVVEGTETNIRFAPVEFDGFKLRHWTKPFVGQRFSLVWFTPEGAS
jgi:tRNA U38,U39,U40 pseudouridine synthase TruA